MNDLKDLLDLALSDVPGRDARVDPAADLARGRRLLRRRRQQLAGLADRFSAQAFSARFRDLVWSELERRRAQPAGRSVRSRSTVA